MDNIGSPEIRAADPDRVDVTTTPIDIDSDRLGGVLHVRVGVAKPQFEAPQSTIIMPVAWSDSPEHRFQQERSQLMADVTGGQVLTIGFPGMGGEYNDPHNQLSEKDLEEIRRGRLSTYAKGVWQALEQNNDELLLDGSGNRLPVGLWLNSLGTLVGSELLATAPEGTTVSDVYFSESMALRRMKTALLIGLFVSKSSHRFNEYKATNIGAKVKKAEVPLVRQAASQIESHYQSVKALAGGQQIPVLQEAIASENSVITDDTLFHVVRAGEGLERPTDNERLIRFLNLSLSNRFGMKPNIRVQELAGEGHGYQDSLPVVQALVDDLQATHLGD